MINELIKKHYKIIIFLIIIIYLLFIKKTNINISLKLSFILLSSIFLLYFLINMLSVYEHFPPITQTGLSKLQDTKENDEDLKTKNIGNRTVKSIKIKSNTTLSNFKRKEQSLIGREGSKSTNENNNNTVSTKENGTNKTLDQRKKKIGDVLNNTDTDSSNTGNTQYVKTDLTKVTIKDRIKKSAKIIYGNMKTDESKEAKSLKKKNKRGTLNENIVTQLQGRQTTLGKTSGSTDVITESQGDDEEDDEVDEVDTLENALTKNTILTSDSDAVQNEL